MTFQYVSAEEAMAPNGLRMVVDPVTRAALETRDARTDAALAPILLAHRDMLYAEYLELPLAL